MAYAALVLKFATDLAELQSGVKRATTLVEREFKQMNRVAQNFQRTFQAAFVATGVASSLRAVIREVTQAEESEKRLASAIRATGGAVGLTTKEIEDLNDELAKTSRFDDEGIRTAAANLVNFGNISEAVFKRALKLAADLAERTGQDIGTAATQLGKGLQDPGNVDSVARGIIKLTAAEKARADELVRLNDLQGAQNILLTAGERRIGGTAEAMNTGLLRATADVAKEWNNLLEELGKTEEFGGRATRVFDGLAAVFRDLILAIRGVPNSLTDLSNALDKFSPVRLGERAGARVREFLGFKDERPASEFHASGKITNPQAEADSQVAARIAAANARNQAIQEEYERRSKEIAKATAGTLVSIEIDKAKRISAEEKSLADDRIEMLERFHSEGLLGEKDYWQARLAVQEQALQAQIKAADAEIAQRKRAVGIASKDAAVTGAGAVAYLNAQKELAVALEKRNDLEAEGASLRVRNYLDARAAAIQYKDAIEDINAQLLELQGNSAAAAAIRFEQQTRGLSRQAAGDPATLAKIEALRKATTAQAEFNDVQRRSELLTKDLALQEERIRNSRESGAISEIRSLQETGAARAGALADLQAIGAEMKRIADESDNPFLVQQAQAFRLEIEKLATQTDLLADKFDKIGETAFADFLTDVIDGTKSVKDAFKDMADSILKQVNRLAAEDIATRIFGGKPGGGEGIGFGSIFSKLFSGGFSLSSGGGAAAGSSLVDAFVGLADGGRAKAGQPYIVGEGGEPEWFVPDVSGTVVPFSKAGMGGRVSITNNFTINGPADRRTQEQVAAAALRGGNRALSRNG